MPRECSSDPRPIHPVTRPCPGSDADRMPPAACAPAPQLWQLGDGHHTSQGASRPGKYLDPTAAEPRAGSGAFRMTPKKSSERNYLVRRYSSVTTFSAKRSPRPFPIIFATFDPRFLAACPYLSRWPTSWSAIRSGRCSSLRTRVTRSGTRFLRQRSSDCSTATTSGS